MCNDIIHVFPAHREIQHYNRNTHVFCTFWPHQIDILCRNIQLDHPRKVAANSAFFSNDSRIIYVFVHPKKSFSQTIYPGLEHY
jgi:hypothetical protein